MRSLVHTFPWLTFSQSLALLRVATAVFFMAHASVRIYLNTIPNFAHFLSSQGWPLASALVWAITVTELVSGLLLITGRFVRWGVAALLFIDVMGIVLIHAKLGWFVGEHGTGGVEYSLALIVSLIMIAAADRDRPAFAASESGAAL